MKKFTMTYIAENGVGLTDEMLNAMAAEYENGSWHGIGKISAGRPRVFNEEMETVSFRIPKSRVAAIEAAAQRTGETKSDLFRSAVDRLLLSIA